MSRPYDWQVRDCFTPGLGNNFVPLLRKLVTQVTAFLIGRKHVLPRWTGVEAVRTRTSVTREPTGIRFISEVCSPWLSGQLDNFCQTAHAQRFSGGSSMARCPEPASITTEGCLWTVPQGDWSLLVLDADDQLDRLPADGGYRRCNDGARSLCFQRMPMRICID